MIHLLDINVMIAALVVKNSGRLVTLDTSIPTHAAVELIA